MPRDDRPNILLITTDQQRYDTLGVHGADWMKTPNIDALAGRGVVFRNAFAQATNCIPSRACVATGRYPHQHGLRYMEDIIDDTPPLPDHERTFLQHLQTCDYHTAGFGKTHLFPEKGFHEKQTTGGKGSRWTKSAGLEIGLAPLGRDYAAWLEKKHPGAYEMIYEQRRGEDYEKYHASISNVLPLENYVDTWCAENTIEVIRRDHDRPFFIQCGFCGPHGPHDPPKPYDTMYPEDEIQFPPNYCFNEDGSERVTTDEEDRRARRMVSYYWGLVTLIDDQVGRIVAALEETGQLDNTLIIYTSDHGEMMFDFGRLGKGNFYEPTIHVPLIAVPPGGLTEGRFCDGIAETFDIAPTVLDYAGVSIPARTAASSFRPVLEGGESTKDVAMCQHMENDRSYHSVCVRTDRFKYAWFSDGREQFYDLKNDPHERNNLIHDPASGDDLARHRVRMIERLADTGPLAKP